MKRIVLLFIPFVVALFVVGCVSESNDDGLSETSDVDTIADVVGNEDVQVSAEPLADEGSIVIYYNLPSPAEMAKIIEQTDAKFYPELLNPASNLDNYITTTQKALNVGVYGVDLSYIKTFGRNQLTIDYLMLVKEIVSGLGIPESQTAATMESLEASMSDKKKLNELIDLIYVEADKYLKDADRESTATLVILGGWIEGIYLATQIYKKGDDNPYIINRIAEQKYALNNVLELVVAEQDDPAVKQFIAPLLSLKRVFDKVVLNYEDANPQIDTINKVIILSDQTYVGISDQEIEEITKEIKNIRDEIVK